VLAGLVYTEYAFIRDYPMEHFWSFDVVIALIFLLMVNVVYTGLYYYDQYLRNHTLSQQLAAEKLSLTQELELAALHLAVAGEEAAADLPPVDYLVVKVGRREIVIPYADIRCFYSAGKETYVVTRDDKQYVLDQSLDRLCEQLPEHLFFRANRQFVLTALTVEQVQPDAYGKLAVQLAPSARLPERITISRERAASFRQWLRRPAEAE
jgi:DNA-binding LytR/AlgR family response regulator